jgi:diaminopimelate epimerase
MDLRFYKLRVCDADLILVDDTAGDGRDRDWNAAARVLLDRRKGVGGDRLAVLARVEEATWLRAFDPDGEPSAYLFDAALCAARFLLDSGRGDEGGVRFRVPGGELAVDLLDAASLGIDLGSPRGLPAGEALSQEAAAGRLSVIEAAGERYEVLPLGLGSPAMKTEAGAAPSPAGAGMVAVFYEGGASHARARIRSGKRRTLMPETVPIRVVSREELRIELGARHRRLDAASTAGLALAAAASASRAERGGLVRLGRDALWVEWTEADRLYVACRPEYVFMGEFHLDEPRQDGEPSRPSSP